MRSWKLAGHPNNPIGDIVLLNCPIPGTVNAVKCLLFSSKGICQNPEVRSSVEKIVDPALPISPMHSLIFFIEYLSSWLLGLNTLKSWTTLIPPSFWGTRNMGLLYQDIEGWTMPSLSHSWTCFSRYWWWVSRIVYCFWKIGSSVFVNFLCLKLFAFPKSSFALLKVSWFWKINCLFKLLSLRFNLLRNSCYSASDKGLTGFGCGLSLSSSSIIFFPSIGWFFSPCMFPRCPFLYL